MTYALRTIKFSVETGRRCSRPGLAADATGGLTAGSTPFSAQSRRPGAKRNVGRIDATARIVGGVDVAALAVLVATTGVSVPLVAAPGLAVSGANRRWIIYPSRT